MWGQRAMDDDPEQAHRAFAAQNARAEDRMKMPKDGGLTGALLGPSFAWAFALFCILAFLMPIWMIVHIAQDRDTQFWIGEEYLWVIMLPLVFLVALLIHVKRRQPHRWAIVLSIVVPCAVVVFVGDSIFTKMNTLSDQLYSSECQASIEKQALQASWIRAYRFYSNCLDETMAKAGTENNITMDMAMNLYSITDCEDYATNLEKNKKQWLYFQQLEEEELCGGWCSVSRPLWTPKEVVVDSCSIAVATSMKTKVIRTATQATVLAVICLVVISATCIMVHSQIIRSLGRRTAFK